MHRVFICAVDSYLERIPRVYYNTSPSAVISDFGSIGDLAGAAAKAVPKVFEFNARTGVPIVRLHIAMCRRMIDLYVNALIAELAE